MKKIRSALLGLFVLIMLMTVDSYVYKINLEQAWNQVKADRGATSILSFRDDLREQTAFLFWRRLIDDAFLSSAYTDHVREELASSLEKILGNVTAKLYDTEQLHDDWKTTQSVDTVTGYLVFLDKWTASDEAFEAREIFWQRAGSSSPPIRLRTDSFFNHKDSDTSYLLRSIQGRLRGMGFTVKQANEHEPSDLVLDLNYSKYLVRTWKEIGGTELFNQYGYSFEIRINSQIAKGFTIFRGDDVPSEGVRRKATIYEGNNKKSRKKPGEFIGFGEKTLGSKGKYVDLPQGSIGTAGRGAVDSLLKLPFYIHPPKMLESPTIALEALLKSNSNNYEGVRLVVTGSETAEEKQRRRMEIDVAWLKHKLRRLKSGERGSRYSFLDQVVPILKRQQFFGLDVNRSEIKYLRVMTQDQKARYSL